MGFWKSVLLGPVNSILFDKAVEQADWVYSKFEEKLDEIEARGRRQGFDDGFREGKAKAAKEFQRRLEQNENLLFAVFAIALYVARLDGEDDKEIEYIANCLGHEELRREDIRHEIQAIYDNQDGFYHIREKYLDKVSFKEIQYISSVVNAVMEADGTVSVEEKDFYNTQWVPYINSRT